MRQPTTPAGVVRGIGALFGGPDYATDPCPRIRENIASQQALGGDRALLGEEVRRQQAYCH